MTGALDFATLVIGASFTASLASLAPLAHAQTARTWTADAADSGNFASVHSSSLAARRSG